jgi:hypothetical protein
VFENHLHDGVRAGTLGVGASRATRSQTHACLECLHDRVDVIDLDLGQVDDVDLLLSVFTTLYDGAVIEQVEQLAAVNFVKGDVEFEVRIHVEILNDVVGGEQVETWDAAVTRPHHRERLPTASLPVGEAGRFGAFKGFRDERQDTLLVNLLVVGLLAVSIVERKQVLLDILG